MTTKIIGNALYLELVPNPELSEDKVKELLGWEKDYVIQVIAFPATEVEGELRSPIVMRRAVNQYSPRAQWKFQREARAIPIDFDEMKKVDNFHYYAKSYDHTDWSALSNTAKRESYAFSLELFLRSLLVDYSQTYNSEKSEYEYEITQAWAVRDNKPIVVEFTEDDLKMAHAHTTPQAVIRRINKVRGTLDKFPEKLVKFA